jgi:hypothetical protein
MWPAQIEDVKAAIRWARANAKSLGSTLKKSPWWATPRAGSWRFRSRHFADSAAALADFFIDRHVIRPRPWAASGSARGTRR